MAFSTIDQLHDAHLDQIQGETNATWDNAGGSKVFLDPNNFFSIESVEPVLFYDHADRVSKKAAGRSKRVFDRLHRLHVSGILRAAGLYSAHTIVLKEDSK